MPIGCDSQLVDLASLTAVPPEERVECFEDRAIAIQGVKIEPFGAGGCPGDQIPGEGWLRPCVLDGMLFAPAPGAADALLVILHPDLGLALDAVPTGVPLTVTGHFDDPAAQSCRLLVDHQEVVDPSLIDQCRQQFVATAIDGP